MDPVARERGREAEERATRHLRAGGCRILARNLRTKSGEIDIVARDGPVVVIVEVRYRRAHVFSAWRSLSGAKRRALLRATRETLAALRVPRSTPIRFDVVLISSDGALTHVRGAIHGFRPYTS